MTPTSAENQNGIKVLNVIRNFRQAIRKVFPVGRLKAILIDRLLAISAPAIGAGFRAFYRYGPAAMPKARRAFQRASFFPLPRHYYYPAFHPDDLPSGRLRSLPGIALTPQEQVNFLSGLTCKEELLELELDRVTEDEAGFRLGNGLFESGDAEFLYQFIRRIKPRKVIEIGAGHSTKLAHEAVKKNVAEGLPFEAHIAIEPYEQPWLESLDIQVIRQTVESCPLELFHGLHKGDLLFVDSSHIIRRGGDVLKIYLEIIPILQKGVYVHIHDIFTPADYPLEWTLKFGFLWNEQYLLEALLANKSRYKVIAALNFLKNNHYHELLSVCPYLSASREPGSFYLQIV